MKLSVPKFIRSISYNDALRSLNEWKNNAKLFAPAFNISHKVANVECGGVKAAHYLKGRWFASSKQVRDACNNGQVSVNGKKIYTTRKIMNGDTVNISFKETENADGDFQESVRVNNKLQRLLNFTNNLLDMSIKKPPLHIIYEDEHLAIVLKPAGIHTHQWAGTMKKQFFTLDDTLPLLLTSPSPNITTKYVKQLDQSSDTEASLMLDLNEQKGDSNCFKLLYKPQLCHRLDARVPGCMLVAKTICALQHIKLQFQTRTIKKEYRAILIGNVFHCEAIFGASNRKSCETNTSDDTLSFCVDYDVNGKKSSTVVKILNVTSCNVYGSLSEVVLYPLTGRRHQLRQHCAAIGCPILGDDLYHKAAFVHPLENRLAAIALQDCNSNKKPCNNNGNNYYESGEVDSEGEDDNFSVFSSSNKNTVHNLSALIDSDNITGNINDYDTVCTPDVRKGVGMFLMASGIEFDHPVITSLPPPNDAHDGNKMVEATIGDSSHDICDISLKFMYPSRIMNNFNYDTDSNDNSRSNDDSVLRMKVSISAPPKYRKVLDKAAKGAAWRKSNAVASDKENIVTSTIT